MITVDQERMKEYIGMGFDKEDAFRMCKEEADALNKEEAKAAKNAAKVPEGNNEGNNEGNSEGNEGETEFIKKEEVGGIVKDTIKSLKDDEEFKNFLKENYSSYSGFISSMADNLDEFYQQDGWKQFVQVVMFALKDHKDDMKDSEESMWEAIMQEVL